MSKTTITKLAEFGQSIWLDYISRAMIKSGKLKKFIDDGVLGMTSNPTIFNQAISGSADYDDKIAELYAQGKSTFEIYDELTIGDIQDAADAFKDVYQKTRKNDGYVSLEINPKLAHKIKEQVEEGMRLFKKVDRENVMIKVPSTKEGLAVIEELIAKGINVNATLIFSVAQYEQVVKAYLRGLGRLSQKTKDLSNVRSVASVFVSRIDTQADKLLDGIIARQKDGGDSLRALKGKAAVANSRMIFEKYQELFEAQEFILLAQKNGHVQRLLWASTGTKNGNYSDVKYIEELIAKFTVNTVPENTLNAFLNHGQVRPAFDYPLADSLSVVKTLRGAEIDVDKICDELLKSGVIAFEDAFTSLFASIEKKTAQLVKR